VTVGLLAAAGLAHTSPPGPQVVNAASAINTTATHVEISFSWMVRSSNAPDVVAANSALAVSRCRDCSTGAVAFQVLLLADVRSTVTAGNQAVAVDEPTCVNCQTVAMAYQFIVASTGPLWLTRRGWLRLQLVHRELVLLLRQTLPGPVLQARTAALARRLQAVLFREVHTQYRSVSAPTTRRRWSPNRDRWTGQTVRRRPARSVAVRPQRRHTPTGATAPRRHP
jgi:hypothetical protein